MMHADSPTLEAFLRAPISDERPWVVFAACRNVDPEIFFPNTSAEERAAVAVCATCPVRSECGDYAFEAREHFGVWGGEGERERRSLRRSA